VVDCLSNSIEIVPDGIILYPIIVVVVTVARQSKLPLAWAKYDWLIIRLIADVATREVDLSNAHHSSLWRRSMCVPQSLLLCTVQC
jgi:hypothetical protein